MKYVVILFTLLFYQIEAQNANNFMGFIKLNDSSVITYKLSFDINGNKLYGYSITDKGRAHETKSTITGVYDATNKLLSFKEIDIIYTKSTISQDDFCNVHFLPTKFKLGKTTRFNGPFKGFFKDGTECINGEIYFNSIENIAKRVSKVAKKINKSKKIADSIKQKVNAMKIVDTVNLNVLKKNQVTSVFTKSHKIRLSIYDGGQIDDDIISITKNEKVLLKNHRISDKREVLDVELVEPKTRFTILSESVGSIGSNTAIIEIIDNGKTIKTMTNLEKDEKTSISIVKLK